MAFETPDHRRKTRHWTRHKPADRQPAASGYDPVVVRGSVSSASLLGCALVLSSCSTDSAQDGTEIAGDGDGDGDGSVEPLCDGSQEVRLHIFEVGGYGDFIPFLLPYGNRHIAVLGTCEYIIGVENAWGPIKRGTLTQDQALALMEDFYYPSLFDEPGTYGEYTCGGEILQIVVWNGHESVECVCGCEDAPDRVSDSRDAFVPWHDELWPQATEEVDTTLKIMAFSPEPGNDWESVPWPLGWELSDFAGDNYGYETPVISVDDGAEMEALRQARSEFHSLNPDITSTLHVPVVFSDSEGERYSVLIREHVDFTTTRWVTPRLDKVSKQDIDKVMSNFKRKCDENLYLDGHDDLVYLAPNKWNLSKTEERFPELRFEATREHS